MKKFISFSFVISLMAFFVVGCSNNTVFESNSEVAEVDNAPVFATAQALNTTKSYSIAKNGSKWLSFPVSNGVKYTLSASDMYGYTGTRPKQVLDLTVFKTESTSGTKLIATWYNSTSDGTTTPDAKSFTANYTGTAFFYLKEINRSAGTTSVKITGGTASSSSSSVSSSSSSVSSSSSTTTTQDGTTAAKAFVLSAGQALNKTTTATNKSVWFKINAAAGTTYTVNPGDKSSSSSFSGVYKYYAYSSNGTTAIKFGTSAYTYIYSSDPSTQRTVKATDGAIYIKAVSTTAGTFSISYTGGSSSSSSTSSTSSSTSSTTGEAALGSYSGKVYVSGNAALVTKNTSYGLVLMGGGSEDDNAMKWMVSKSGGGDFVVLRADDPGAGSYAPYIFGLGGVDSVHEVVVNSTTLANSTYIDNLLRSAEAVFIAGGDQNAYRNYWNGTKVETALLYLANTKKIPIGGTSAGCHALGGIMYSPTGTAVISSEALANPYHANMNIIVKDFLVMPLMTNIITDTHWSERDRLGRTLTLLARVIKDGTATLANARAIAVDECTAVAVDANGSTKVFGDAGYDDYAYFFKPDTTPNTCVSGSKLNWTDAVTVTKVKGSATGTASINITSWPTTGTAVNVSNGVVSSNIQTPN